MRTNTKHFEAAHGKLPRGYAHWTFNVEMLDKFGNPLSREYTLEDQFAKARDMAGWLALRDVPRAVRVTSITVEP